MVMIMSFSTINALYSKLHSTHGADYKANGYTSWRMFNIRKKLVTHMVQQIPLHPTCFFDAGCGNGFFFEHVVKGLLGNSLRLVHGIDNVPAAAKNASSIFDKTFTGSVLEMTLHTNEKYDLVLSNEVFQYIEKERWDQFFQQHAGLVRSGGFFLLTIPNLQSIYRFIVRPPKDMFPVDYCCSDVLTLAEQHGLALMKFSGADIFGNVYTDMPLFMKKIISFVYSFLFKKA